MINVTSASYEYDIEIDKEIKEGVVVLDVSDKSSAKNAGLQKGDIIIAIDNNRTKDTAYLRYELYQHQAGDTIEITIIRNKKERKIKVKL